MLTSSASQYLHPDYLQPLPTTLDAKKSPLALLAQTCSSIGKDTTPSKPIIPPLEKKEGSSGRKSESPSGKTGRSSSEERKSQSGAEKTERSSPSGDGKASFRAPPPKDIPPLVPISSSSSDKRASSASPVSSKVDREREKDNSSVSSSGQLTSSGSGPSAGIQSNSRISLSCGNMLLEVNHQEAATAAGLPKPASAPSSHPSLGSTLKPDPLSAHHPALHPGLSSAYGCLPMLGHPGLSLEAANSHLHGLSAHSSLGLASAAAKAAAAGGVSPYTYARVKTTAGATTLVPICRDPYCTNCQITMQNAQLTQACAAGCTQCSHEKGYGGVPTSLGTVPVLPLGLSSTASSLPLSSSLYHHAFGMVPGHHSLPYVCSWVSTGSDYCGKRFATSEELLQHLRTHTSSVGEAALAHHAGLSAYSSLGLAAPSPLACHTGHYPGSLSPNSIRQGYPRSLSPNSLLAARYHPYKSPLSSLATAPGSSALQGTLPSPLGAYYSPYALYGQRLGAAVAP